VGGHDQDVLERGQVVGEFLGQSGMVEPAEGLRDGDRPRVGGAHQVTQVVLPVCG
jgi:hypothetical protein